MSKKPENKDKLNIQELLKNSGVESMLDLNKLIGKIKKTFYWIYFRWWIWSTYGLSKIRSKF